jgi:hypothetical protein
MTPKILSTSWLAVAFAAVAGAAFAGTPVPSQAAPSQARPLQVVELFTSQGCSSCPPANAAVATLSTRPDILALSFGVTYWDQLGWKDTFAQPRFTDRQWAYAHGLKHANVYTPQVVVNGRLDVVGQTTAEIDGAIRKAPLAAGGPALTLNGPTASVASGAPARPADVWLVRYDPNIVQVPIRRGENGGKTLPHKNVVRELTRLGQWTGAAASWRIPAGPPDLKTAVLLQAGPGGPILAAAKS